MAQVAQPRVQSSFSGGGETPTAQQSQPEAEAEETSDDTPAATPIEVSDEDGAVETSVDTDYVADVASAQGTQDPWPTPTQDTLMPAQDAPTTPHDYPAPAQDD